LKRVTRFRPWSEVGQVLPWIFRLWVRREPRVFDVFRVWLSHIMSGSQMLNTSKTRGSLRTHSLGYLQSIALRGTLTFFFFSLGTYEKV